MPVSVSPSSQLRFLGKKVLTPTSKNVSRLMKVKLLTTLPAALEMDSPRMSLKAACVKAGGLCRKSQVTDAILLLTAHNSEAMTVCWEVLASSTMLICGSETLGPPGVSWGRLVIRKGPLGIDMI